MTVSRGGLVGGLALGVAGGVIGATLAFAIQTRNYQPNAAVVAMVGWFVTLAGWFASARLSERAQRRMFLHNVINEARRKIITTIRDHQEWARKVNGLALRYRGALDGRPFSKERQDPRVEDFFWMEQNKFGREVLFQSKADPGDLVMVFEEYALLFPGTEHAIHQLSFFAHERIGVVYTRLVSDLLYQDKREAAIAAMEARGSRNADYQALLEDLRVHVQNVGLAEITGRRVPQREPRDPNVPITLTRPDGTLDIVERGQSWPVRTWPPEPLPEWWG